MLDRTMILFFISLVSVIAAFNGAWAKIPSDGRQSKNSAADTPVQTDPLIAPIGKKDHVFLRNERSIQNLKKRSVPEDESKKSTTNSDYVSSTTVIHTETTSLKPCEVNFTESMIPSCTNSSINRMFSAYTCESRCNDSKMIPGIFMGPYCSCHPLCLISHDCCQDFEEFCPELYELGERKREILVNTPNSLAKLDCMNLFTETSDGDTYWKVGHCPKDNVNETTRLNCEGNITDFIQIVPVVSRTTDVIYKNYFCAQCNNVFDVVAWDLNVTCIEVWEGSIDSPKTLLDLVNKKTCILTYKPLVEHICLSRYFSQQTCTDQATSCIQKYKDLCEHGFQAPISNFYIRTSFKNIYCLMCVLQEGFSMDGLSCDLYGDTTSIVSPENGGFAKFSFGILVDYNPSGGNKVGFIFKDETRTFGCDLANSENMDCVSYCANGFQYINGECVLKYQTFEMEVNGLWSAPDLHWLVTAEIPWKDLKKTLTELFLDILQSSIIETVTLEYNFHGGNHITFLINCKYKLNVDNTEPLVEIHKSLFNNIIAEIISAHPKITPEILNLYEACMTLFEKMSCWEHGRITEFGNIIGGIITLNNITHGQNKTNQSESTNQTSHTEGAFNKTDCPRKQLQPNSVNILTNGSVVLLNSGQLLLDGDFLLVGNMVYICVNETGMPDARTEIWKYDDTMGLLTIICTSLSLVCMFIRLILQPFVPLFQNFPGKLQFLFILSLFLASLFFIIGPNCTAIFELCVTLGVLTHWSYLAVFTWTVIIARDMFHIFSPSSFAKSSDTNHSVLKLYTLLAWGIPAVIVAICLSLDFSNIDPTFKPMYGKGVCWISQRYALLIFFTSPIAITILINLGFFIPTAIFLWKSMKKRMKQSSNHTSEYPFGIYAKLFCLMGFTWIFAFVAPYNIALWYIFIVLNASQGVYIFLAFVLRKQVWESLIASKKPTSKTNSSALSKSTGQTELNNTVRSSTNVNVKNDITENEIETNVDSVNLEIKNDIKVNDDIKLKSDSEMA